MKLKIFLSIFCLIFAASIHSMDEKIKTEDLPLMLFMGIESNNIEQVKKTLDLGVDVNIIHIHTGDTALIKAAAKKNKDIVELLLKYKADPNIVNRNKETALMWATQSGSLDMINLLLQANSHLEIKERTWKFSALALARYNKFDIIAETLQDEPAKRLSNWVKIRSEISKKTPLIPVIANIVAEYLEPEEDYEEYFV